jgi:hypothetical protein
LFVSRRISMDHRVPVVTQRECLGSWIASSLRFSQ